MFNHWIIKKYFNYFEGKIINEQNSAATKRLEKGVVIFVDNFRVMHGRTGFDGNRTVSGAYLTRDDWISTARTFGLLPTDFYWKHV